MSISYINSASGTNTATMPAHQAGDLIIVWAFRDGSSTIPTLVSGYTGLQSNSANASPARLAYKIAGSSSETVGTWTGATSVIVMIYRGSGSMLVGNSALTTGSNNNINYPALNMGNNDGESWVVGFAGHRSVNGALETPPTGMTNRVDVVDATDEAVGHDTNGGVSSWTSKTVSTGATSSGYSTACVEIIDSGDTASVSSYYFDGHNGIVNNNSAWTNATNVFDGNEATYGSTASGNLWDSLQGDGTTAPMSGDSIVLVRARLMGQSPDDGSTVTGAVISSGTTYGSIYVSSGGSATYGDYSVITEPVGGWTWAALNALRINIYKSVASAGNVYNVQIEVTTVPAPSIGNSGMFLSFFH